MYPSPSTCITMTTTKTSRIPPPDYEEVVEVDPGEADALIDEGIGAAA